MPRDFNLNDLFGEGSDDMFDKLRNSGSGDNELSKFLESLGKEAVENMPLDQQLKLMATVALAKLDELGPIPTEVYDEIADAIHQQLDQADAALEEIGPMLPMVTGIYGAMAGAVVGGLVAKAASQATDEKLTKSIEDTKKILTAIGEDKSVALSRLVEDILPPKLAALREALEGGPKTDDQLRSEYQDYLAKPVEELVQARKEKLAKIPASEISAAITKAASNLSAEGLYVAKETIAEGLPRESLSALFNAAVNTARDFLENAAADKPFTVTDKAQAADFAAKLKDALTVVENAVVDSGILNGVTLAETLKQTYGKQGPSGPQLG